MEKGGWLQACQRVPGCRDLQHCRVPPPTRPPLKTPGGLEIWRSALSPPQADLQILLGMDNVDLLPPTLTHDHRVYSKELTEEDETKEEENRRMETRPNSNTWQLDALSPRDVKILIQAEEELSQTKVVFQSLSSSIVSSNRSSTLY